MSKYASSAWSKGTRDAVEVKWECAVPNAAAGRGGGRGDKKLNMSALRSRLLLLLLLLLLLPKLPPARP